MAKINSRNKGAQFERDVVRILNNFFIEEGIDFQAKRNLDQYQQRDLCDLQIPNHAIECKFYKEGDWVKPEWWRQICASCEDNIPVLIYKYNRKPIRVCIPLYAINPDWVRDNQAIAVMTMDDWLSILKTNWDLYGKC